jgi:hypothetical protein
MMTKILDILQERNLTAVPFAINPLLVYPNLIFTCEFTRERSPSAVMNAIRHSQQRATLECTGESTQGRNPTAVTYVKCPSLSHPI